MSYPFDAISAIDPQDPSRVAADAEVTIAAPGDETQTPIPLTDLTGLPLPNPVLVNSLGFGPAFQAEIPSVAWYGGTMSGLLHSYTGLKEDAEAAASSANLSRIAAEAAGSAAEGIPSGGSAGQVLSKVTSTSYDTAWVTPSSGGAVYGAGVMVTVQQVGSGYTRPTSDPTIRYVFTGTADPGTVALENDRWERLD
ncbi:hypothetical protein [Paeniglutamicibacter terrestris]|uniref:Uncharacterized protein n=1 Tax=Paeniglutamicibacter terrestris TaxID=2723403 RepID=A0ABX1G4E7_9MICC|nr:hypothetical protein [Paeniglutamicibacter terrestris]NKG21117.1 hypothetical protein [Paeniglutamicibacter terrestris]